MSTRYVVIGAGAIGALLAAQLELAGKSVVLVARGANLEAIRAGGVRVRRPRSTEQVRVPVVGGPQELHLTHQDVLVLATKTQDAEPVLAGWAWLPVSDEHGRPTLLAADLPLLTFQNGLATEDLAVRRFGRVYGVSIGVAASHLTPGEVVSPSYPIVGVAWLGRYRAADPGDEGAQFARDLREAGYDVSLVEDVRAYKARKLLLNLANGLGVLQGSDTEREQARALLVPEARAVFAAAGIEVAPEATAHLVVEEVPGHVGGNLSTWQSFARGSSSEVDHLNGEIVRLGRLHGVPTPANERLQRLLGAQAAAGLPPDTNRLSDLLSDLIPVP
ncbi:NAD(P)-binding domain-containing protein [Kineosporia rhizophila]|uniref:ketopantoate reductase family protein n=1 Tax=Kineosporia rhizophila TaxID=84633 RepID=UPI001E33E5DB|nr:2-dehydropantoate 2-reductase N-terminal domain-containing protein [Kineosporia rhizophila]MCE0535592.1 NAD(P)-binding domain-containing protein [Kineosporia rhizophila]